MRAEPTDNLSPWEHFARTGLQFIKNGEKERTSEDVLACLTLVRASLLTLLRELQRDPEGPLGSDHFDMPYEQK